MPTDTFFNLPAEKRERIMALALEEFAHHTYHGASISRIVQRAGIAKGSIYQYFNDKFDVYTHLLSEAIAAKMRLIGPAVAALGPEADVFAMYLAASRAGLVLIEQEPLYAALGNNLMTEPDLEIRNRALARFSGEGDAMMEAWISRSITAGVIDQRIRPQAARHVMVAVTTPIGQDLLAGRIDADMAMKLLEETFDILQYGMRPQPAAKEERT